MDFKSDMREKVKRFEIEYTHSFASASADNDILYAENNLFSSLLALIEKNFPKERSHKDSCDYEAWSCTCGATEYNEAISEIKKGMGI